MFFLIRIIHVFSSSVDARASNLADIGHYFKEFAGEADAILRLCSGPRYKRTYPKLGVEINTNKSKSCMLNR